MTPRKTGAWLHSAPLHPFLVALYPILALFGLNASQLDGASILRPLVVSLLAAGLLAGAFYPVYRDWRRAALVASILLGLFFSYGHVYILLKGIQFNGMYLFRHRTLVPLYLVLAALLIWWASRGSRNLQTITYTLNLVGLFVLVLPLGQSAVFALQRGGSPTAQSSSALDLNTGTRPPDIYYIILDGYGRADVLAEEFGYDNSAFLDELSDLGFYVAECSQSNYAQTQISLASSLNFNYLEALSDHFVAGSENRAGLDQLIHHSAARQSLEQAGYTTVAFATGFVATEWTDADYFLGPGYSWSQLNGFEALLMETTLARLIQDGNRFGMQTAGSERFRERTLFALDRLDELDYIPGPKFVFLHLIIPHPPYVFGPTGGPVQAADVGTTQTQHGASQYRDQVIYANSRLGEILPQLIEGAGVPPVILLQGDHGPTVPSSPRARMSNLSAYYLPGAEASLYSTITPVNSFRVVFNAYFQQRLPLLEDVSLYSEYEDPFNFRVIPNTCP